MELQEELNDVQPNAAVTDVFFMIIDSHLSSKYTLIAIFLATLNTLNTIVSHYVDPNPNSQCNQ